jgi:stearoyl-CoA desaturase (delta-9 desaturase)
MAPVKTATAVPSEQSAPAKSKSMLSEINWINTIVVFSPVLLAFYGFLTTAWCWQTFLLMFGYYYLTGIGITAGYHRLWSHRAYEAAPALQWFLTCMGAASYQGSAIWWCRNHRVHHRYIDTERDPYNATRGFVYTHFGWMVLKQDYTKLGRADISDLRALPCLRFQHRHYLPVAFSFGVLLPWLVAGFGWGDWRGGFFYAAMLRIVLVHNSTFFVNSLAHSSLFGAIQSFSDQNTSHDSMVTALLTLGEGYHNFHHEFPHDYRNGIRFFHFDPTKWTIRALSWIGLAYNLSRAPQNEISREKIEMSLRRLQRELKTVDCGPDPATLAEWTWEEIGAKCKAGAKLTCLHGFVVDLMKPIAITKRPDVLLPWYNHHPGGKQMLEVFVGKDATGAFEGQTYMHSRAANILSERMRVARVANYKEE